MKKFKYIDPETGELVDQVTIRGITYPCNYDTIDDVLVQKAILGLIPSKGILPELARVEEMVDSSDLKSDDRNGRAGSSPASGTNEREQDAVYLIAAIYDTVKNFERCITLEQLEFKLEMIRLYTKSFLDVHAHDREKRV